MATIAELQLEARDGSVTIHDTTAGANNVALTRPRDPLDPESPNAVRGPDGLYDGFNGAGYLDMGGNVGDAFSFNLAAPEAGSYTFTFRYASPSDRPMSILVDGVQAGQLAFASTGSFATWQTAGIDLALGAGNHVIRLANLSNNGPNLDQVVVTHEPVVVPPDTTADEGGDLALILLSGNDPTAVRFAVTGLDADIESTSIRVNGGSPISVALDAQGHFTLDLSAHSGTVAVALTVQDEVPNSATVSTSVDLDAGGPSSVQFFDGKAFTNLNPGSTIIRVESIASTHEPNSNFDKDGDGLNDNHDGDSYADFGGGIGDKLALTVTVATAGVYDFDMRLANGSTAPRPIAISANGQTVAIADTRTANMATWNTVHFQLNLEAGDNTVVFRQTAANGGPNIDSVKVTSSFSPDYAEIDGTGRIELESGGHARILSTEESEFYFTVSSNGLYGLDLAANPGASAGAATSYYLSANGGAPVLIDTTAYPGVGTAGEVTAWTALQSGVNYKLTVATTLPGADELDYLDVRSVGSATANIVAKSQDPAYFADRLQFNWLEDPVAKAESPREYKDTAVVRISNTGTTPLQILDADISDHFSIVTSNVVGSSIAAGQFRDITVAFDGSLADGFPGATKRTLYEGELVLKTNDGDDPVTTIELAALWQRKAENGNEPNVNEVWKTFGFGTSVPISGLNHYGIYEKVNNLEVLSPTWRLADGVSEAKITQLAAYHGPGGGVVSIHAPDAKGTFVQLFNGNSIWNQSVLPIKINGGFATTTITHAKIPDAWAGDDVFSISVAGYSTNPALNTKGPVIVPGMQQGHYLRMFEALDGDGHVIPNTYLGIQDYAGINYDYNDNMILVEGITPADTLL